MVWVGFCSKGKLEINFISTKSNSQDYVKVLQNNLLRQGRRLLGRNMVFQQDNAAIHSSKFTMQWFKDNKITVLDWPSLSPDLNPTENVWSYLVKNIYANGKQYENINQLKQAIVSAWSKCPMSYLKDLVNSMQDRIYQVIMNHGGKTKY